MRCYAWYVIQIINTATAHTLGKCYGAPTSFCLPDSWLEVSMHPEGPATGRLDTGLLGFPVV
jgi:hypothetical protein